MKSAEAADYEPSTPRIAVWPVAAQRRDDRHPDPEQDVDERGQDVAVSALRPGEARVDQPREDGDADPTAQRVEERRNPEDAPLAHLL